MAGADGLDDLHRQVLESLPAGVAVWTLMRPLDDTSLHLAYSNPAASSLTGRDLAEARGRPILEVFPGITRERIAAYAAVARSRSRADLGTIDYQKPGSAATKAFAVVAIPVLVRSLAVLFEDVSGRTLAEASAREANHFLDSVVENIPAMVFVKRAEDLRFERFNRAGEELLGMPRSALQGKNDYDFFPREQADFFVAKDREVLAQKKLVDIPEEPIETPDGTRWLHTRKIPILDDRGEPRYLLGVSLDITERRRAEEVLRAQHAGLQQAVDQTAAQLSRAEEQLRRAQRMEAIGQLAGGIAHDFNNLLSVILSSCDFLADGLPPGNPLREDVENVRRAGERAAELTRQLLAFGRRQVLRPRVFDLAAVVKGMAPMIGRLVGEDIELRLCAVEGRCRAKADPAQIEQVLMNLVVNARDAMPDGGRLTIETAPLELDDRYVATHVGSSRGPHAMLAVGDTGVGMGREVQEHLFEPFYTTKERGRGTGLGLSTVYGIVKQSGGSIWVYSEPGRGTCFRIYLPATGEAVEPTAPAVPTPVARRGTETVLLVEDEDEVRRLANEVLSRAGYRVLPCRRAAEALEVEAREGGAIELLLTDVVMPGMGGVALADKVRSRRSGIRVLFMSGYADDALLRQGSPSRGPAFLQKPLTVDGLLSKVRAVLDTPLMG